MAPTLLIVCFALSWAVIERIAPAARLPAGQVVLLRYGSHLLLMIAWFGRRAGSSLFRSNHTGLQILRSSMMLIMPLSFIAATRLASVETTLALFWLAPLIVLAIDRQAAVTVRHWLGGLIGFGGTVLILRPSRVHPSALLFALSMAGAFAAYERLTRAVSGDRETTSLFHTALWVFVALSFWVIPNWQPAVPLSVGIVALVGLIGLLGLYAFDLAIRRGPAGLVAPALYVQPAFAALLATFTGGAPLGRRALAGIVLVAGGVALASLPPTANQAGESA